MLKALVRIVVCLLIPCLMAEPALTATGSALLAPPGSSRTVKQSLYTAAFESEALQIRSPFRSLIGFVGFFKEFSLAVRQRLSTPNRFSKSVVSGLWDKVEGHVVQHRKWVVLLLGVSMVAIIGLNDLLYYGLSFVPLATADLFNQATIYLVLALTVVLLKIFLDQALPPAIEARKKRTIINLIFSPSGLYVSAMLFALFNGYAREWIGTYIRYLSDGERPIIDQIHAGQFQNTGSWQQRMMVDFYILKLHLPLLQFLYVHFKQFIFGVGNDILNIFTLTAAYLILLRTIVSDFVYNRFAKGYSVLLVALYFAYDHSMRDLVRLPDIGRSVGFTARGFDVYEYAVYFLSAVLLWLGLSHRKDEHDSVTHESGIVKIILLVFRSVLLTIPHWMGGISYGKFSMTSQKIWPSLFAVVLLTGSFKLESFFFKLGKILEERASVLGHLSKIFQKLFTALEKLVFLSPLVFFHNQRLIWIIFAQFLSGVRQLLPLCGCFVFLADGKDKSGELFSKRDKVWTTLPSQGSVEAHLLAAA
jgi:hypothetical protein